MEISRPENFYVVIGNLRGRGEVRYFVIWSPIGRVLVNKLSADTLSTSQLNAVNISANYQSMNYVSLYQ